MSEDEKKNYIQPMPFSVDISENVSVDAKKNKVRKSNDLPIRYSLKDNINLKVRDQKNTGDCWAFTATNI